MTFPPAVGTRMRIPPASEPGHAGYDRDKDPTLVEMSATAIAAATSSVPVWTVEFNGVIFTVILVGAHIKRQSYQIYAVDQQWILIGLFGLYVDALAEIQAWRVAMAKGYTVAQWRKEHPEGLFQPRRSNFEGQQ